MTETVFVDTAGWLALVNKSDSLHRKARKIRDRLLEQSIRFAVSDYVIVEIANALSRAPWRETAIRLISSIYASDDVIVVEVDKALLQEAWELYRAREDKDWSLTDCTSFVIMNKGGMRRAFTSDNHFEQAGFSVLMKIR